MFLLHPSFLLWLEMGSKFIVLGYARLLLSLCSRKCFTFRSIYYLYKELI
ncbi:hypothetical protein Lalb_Chr01g0014911 [Lupinus albus]|uniref:Uncharacterized protein n=1 Tax=Lupinus albus TaxID=3870 RepID=A0A6A4R3L6_LUPAL|nr:hypothetical protein Lalb_Chr01g0014911 [Lupinus albus]